LEKKAVSGIMLTLMLIGVTLTLNIHPAMASGTIYIRADGSIDPPTAPIQRNGDLYTITGNISSDADGIVIGRNNMTLDGAGYTVQETGSGTGILLYGRSKVTVKNIIITGFSRGIELWASSNNTILGNNITDNDYGVTLSSSSNNNIISGNNITNNLENGISLSSSLNNTISGNNVTANSESGIYLGSSSDNTISSNDVTSNDDGMYLEGSSNNMIHANTLANTDGYAIIVSSSSGNIISENDIRDTNYMGISLASSFNTTLSGNIMSGNKYNFYVYGLFLSGFVHSIDVSNLVDGRPVYYLLNQKDLVINPATYQNIGFLAVINSTNVTVEGLTLTNNGDGLIFAYTSNSRIIGNNITGNSNAGVFLRGCSNNTISGNDITNNSDGVFVRECSNNTISGNNIRNNADGLELSDSSYIIVQNNNIIKHGIGLYLFGCSNSTISDNSVTNSSRCIYLWYSSNNKFYHNNFINNTQQVDGTKTKNIWDNGYPSGGNYWDEYDGLDANGDGIGDKPYTIDADNQDRYPLAIPQGSIPIIWDETIYSIELKSNSTVSKFRFKASQKMISYNVTGSDASIGFCNITIPNILVQELWQGNFVVAVDGEEPIMMNKMMGETYTYIYFTYIHSPHNVTITESPLLPPPASAEAPLWMHWWFYAILAAIIVALAGAVFFLKKRKPPTPAAPPLPPEGT
jgi:parallel beta-helix repeat protein